MHRIADDQRQRIGEDGRGLLERHAVLATVRRGLPRVPAESHTRKCITLNDLMLCELACRVARQLLIEQNAHRRSVPPEPPRERPPLAPVRPTGIRPGTDPGYGRARGSRSGCGTAPGSRRRPAYRQELPDRCEGLGNAHSRVYLRATLRWPRFIPKFSLFGRRPQGFTELLTLPPIAKSLYQPRAPFSIIRLRRRGSVPSNNPVLRPRLRRLDPRTPSRWEGRPA